jgi:hypothetical protein
MRRASSERSCSELIVSTGNLQIMLNEPQHTTSGRRSHALVEDAQVEISFHGEGIEHHFSALNAHP